MLILRLSLKVFHAVSSDSINELMQFGCLCYQSYTIVFLLYNFIFINLLIDIYYIYIDYNILESDHWFYAPSFPTLQKSTSHFEHRTIIKP